jgi:RNA polymerase sigma-70 factor, ECF subfamily
MRTETGPQADDCYSDFSETALKHVDALYGYALTLTRDPVEAQDLVQETYLRAIRTRQKLAANSNLKGWLFVILRNAWLNQIRHARSGPTFTELEIEEANPAWIDVQAADPYVLYLRKLEREEVKQAISSLPILHREIVVLRDIEGFSYREIASMLGCPAGTVMSRLGRAREKLRQILGNRQTGKAARAV